MPTDSVEYLRAVLQELTRAGVMRAQVKVSGLDLSVEFQPEMPAAPLPGEAPVPGGWKTPYALDNPFDGEPK